MKLYFLGIKFSFIPPFILLGVLGMDGEKEKERERGNEKESDETEGAALLWQKGYPDDDLGLPIMQWEDLSLRIAELEKQQEEQRQREKVWIKVKIFICIKLLKIKKKKYSLSTYLQ